MERDRGAASVAATLTAELGRPSFGLVLGSGFDPLGDALAARGAIAVPDGVERERAGVEGHSGTVAAIRAGGVDGWLFRGRRHYYEGLAIADVVRPIEALACAGASWLVTTCAAGGLRADDRPGDFVGIRDHLNLMGVDPLRGVEAKDGAGPFLDLRDAYDRRAARRIAEAARAAGARFRDGVLAAVSGPCFETPAEVRMMRALGADVASMSVVPEVVVARRAGMSVAAVACVANLGAGLDDGVAIRHADVLDTVRASTRGATTWLASALSAVVRPTDDETDTVDPSPF